MWSLLLFASRSSLILAQKVMLNDHQNTVIRLALSRVWPCKTTTTTTIVCQTRSSSPFKAFHRHWNAITRCYTADLTSISAMVPASLLLEPRRCNNKNNNNRTRLDAANYSLYRARIHIWTCADLLWRSYRGLYTPAIYPAYVFFLLFVWLSWPINSILLLRTTRLAAKNSNGCNFYSTENMMTWLAHQL